MMSKYEQSTNKVDSLSVRSRGRQDAKNCVAKLITWKVVNNSVETRWVTYRVLKKSDFSHQLSASLAVAISAMPQMVYIQQSPGVYSHVVEPVQKTVVQPQVSQKSLN